MLCRSGQCIVSVAALLVFSGASAHHSYSEYDDKQIVEIEGVLERSALQNPHVHFFLKGVDQTAGRSLGI